MTWRRKGRNSLGALLGMGLSSLGSWGSIWSQDGAKEQEAPKELGRRMPIPPRRCAESDGPASSGRAGDHKNPRVLDAFRTVPRHKFLPDEEAGGRSDAGQVRYWVRCGTGPWVRCGTGPWVRCGTGPILLSQATFLLGGSDAGQVR